MRRPEGMKLTVDERSGNYVARFRCGGKRHRLSTGSKSPKEAREIARARFRAMVSGSPEPFVAPGIPDDARPIPGRDGYLADPRGNVWSSGSGRLKTKLGTRGYPVARLFVDGRERSFRVHRLVLEAFAGPRPAGMLCRHLNGLKTDNRLQNLSWGTPQENADDRKRHARSGSFGTNIGTPKPEHAEDTQGNTNDFNGSGC